MAAVVLFSRSSCRVVPGSVDVKRQSGAGCSRRHSSCRRGCEWACWSVTSCPLQRAARCLAFHGVAPMCSLAVFPRWRGTSGGARTLLCASVAVVVCGRCLGAFPPPFISTALSPDGIPSLPAPLLADARVRSYSAVYRLQGLPLSSRRKPSSGTGHPHLWCHDPHELSPGWVMRTSCRLTGSRLCGLPHPPSPVLDAAIFRAQPQRLPRPPSPGAGTLLF